MARDGTCLEMTCPLTARRVRARDRALGFHTGCDDACACEYQCAWPFVSMNVLPSAAISRSQEGVGMGLRPCARLIWMNAAAQRVCIDLLI